MQENIDIPQGEPGIEGPFPADPRMSTVVGPDSEMYVPPALEITDEDKFRFIDALGSGEFYRERFRRGGGKIDITFRVKGRRENEYLAASLSNDFVTGEIRQPIDYVQTLNTYNLRIQTCMLGDSAVNPVIIPARPWYDRGAGAEKAGQVPVMETIMGIPPAPRPPQPRSLREQVENSFMAEFNDSRMFVLCSLLAQFEKKVQAMQRMVLDPDSGFSAPVART